MLVRLNIKKKHTKQLRMDLQNFFSFLFPFLLFLFMVILITRKSKTKISNPSYPPGPWKLPAIGNIHQLSGSSPQRRLRDLANKYGPLMHLKLGQVHHIIVSSPEAAKEVMKTHDISFANRPSILPARIIFYDSRDVSFAPYGDYWRQLRKICMLELLSAKRVQSFASIRQEAVSNLIKNISSCAPSPVNLSRMLFSLNYGIISKTALGKVPKEEEAAFIEIVEGVSEVISGLTLADLFPSIKLLEKVSGVGSRMEKLHQEADRMLENIINEHRNRRIMAKNGNKLEVFDLVDVLLDVQEQSKLDFPLATDSIKAVILDIFLGGSETASTLLDWAMSELLRHPEVMEKAQAEVRQAFGRKANVEGERLGELNYLKMVIKETLRLYPPIPLLVPRECTEGCLLSGYQIPQKTRVLVNAWAIGRDPNYWNEAERFNPERFLDNGIDYKGTNFELIPFGAGRRMCPGINFGTTNVELVLANLLYYFDWKLPDGKEVERIDMQENVGGSLRRKTDLELIAVQCNPLLFP